MANGLLLLSHGCFSAIGTFLQYVLQPLRVSLSGSVLSTYQQDGMVRVFIASRFQVIGDIVA